MPPHVVTNHDLAQALDTSDEWITSRTGIHRRHVIDTETATSHLAVEAATRALASAGHDAADLLILATATPDRACPATAPEVAARLGLSGIPAFDLSAVCSGFVYSLATADAFIRAGQADRVLVVAAESFTTLIDPEDRSTRPIFGDGAGAVLLRAGDTAEPGAILGTELHSDGGLVELIASEGGGSRARGGGDDATPYLRMQGKATYIHAIRSMEQVSRSLLDRVGWRPGDLDAVVGHQANARILASLGDKLGLPSDTVAVNIDHLGNTSAASIPLALVYGAVSGRLRAGARVLMPAFGGGATWGAVAITWPDVSVVPYEDEALLALSASNQRTSTIAPGRPDATLST